MPNNPLYDWLLENKGNLGDNIEIFIGRDVVHVKNFKFSYSHWITIPKTNKLCLTSCANIHNVMNPNTFKFIWSKVKLD